jgi:hypothetical protein
MQDNGPNAAGAQKMRVGRLDLIVFSSALFCLGITCTTPSLALPQRPWYLAALDRVLNLVRNDSDTVLVRQKVADKKIEPIYVSRVSKEDGTITFKGDVPSESDLKILQGVAAATSPSAAFADKSRRNANVPNRDAWLAAMTFALRQLGKLEHGVAQFRNSSIIIEGVTKSGDDFAAVQKKLKDEAPKGLSLQTAVKPHDVHPFVWVAKLQPGSIDLSGHVPNQQERQLCDYAQNVFRNLPVNSSMELAEGEPRDWFQAAKTALDMLGLLYSGNASLSDNVVRLEGIYSSPDGPALLKAYAQKLPAHFKLEPHILEPVARGPSAASIGDVNLAAQTGPDSPNRATLNPW